MKFRRTSALFLLSLLSFLAFQDSFARPNWRDSRGANESSDMAATAVETIAVQGVTRSYRIHVPPATTQLRNAPLIFNFHGLGSSAAEQEKVTGFSRLADKHGFIVVYPEGLPNRRGSQHWNTRRIEDRQSELDFVKAMLARLQSQYQIDRRRVYATGISNGGGMANMLAGEMADTFAAIAPVAGAYYDFEMYRPSRAVPVLAFHGTTDRIVPYGGRGSLPDIRRWVAFWAEQNRCGPTPALIYDKGEVRAERWSGAAEVILYTIEGKGHTWPGSDMPRPMTTRQIDASALIWEFFARYTLP